MILNNRKILAIHLNNKTIIPKICVEATAANTTEPQEEENEKVQEDENE